MKVAYVNAEMEWGRPILETKTLECVRWVSESVLAGGCGMLFDGLT